MEPDEILTAAEAAAKNAKRAMVLTALAVIVASLVLAIDHGIKRAIVDEAQNARKTLAEHRELLGQHVITVRREEVKDGTEAAEPGGAAGSAGVGAGNGVVSDATARETVGKAAGPAKRAPGRKPAGTRRGAPGNG